MQVLQQVSNYSQSGVTVTVPAGTDNVKGAWVELVASTTYDMTALETCVLVGSAAACSMLVDIGVGPAGSEVVLVPDLYAETHTSVPMTMGTRIPVKIPAGTRISARAQTNDSIARNASVYMLPESTGATPIFGRGFQRVVQYGCVPASTSLTPVDPGGSANTKGAWVELCAASDIPAKALCACFASNRNTNLTTGDYLVDIGIGTAGNEVVLLPNYFVSVNTTSDVLREYTTVLPVELPVGTRIVARAQSTVTDATDRVVYTQIHLFG